MDVDVVLAANARPGDGGQGLNLLQMVRGLEGTFRVQVRCAEEWNGRAQRIPRLGALDRLFALRGIRRLADWHAYLTDAYFDRQVASQLPRCRLFQGSTGQSLRSLQRARRLGAATLLDVVTVHVDDGNPRVQQASAAEGFTARVHHGHVSRQRREYAAADRIRVMSNHARQTFLERGFSPDQVFALNPFIELDGFPQARFREPVFRVCFVGRLVIGKGFHHLIRAYQSAGLPESELVLWGGTGERPVHQLLLRLLAGSRGIVQRPVPIRSVGLDEVYGKASVFVHPSLADGFGLSVAEAMASGLPVIVTRTTGAADWVRDGVNGFLVEPGDVDGLCDRLRWCHQNADRLPEMGRAARETAAEYTFERFRRTYLEEVKRLT